LGLTEGSVVLAENTIENKNITYENGVLSFLNSGILSVNIQLHLDVISGSNAIVETWAEFFNGSVWDIYPDSGRFLEFQARTEGVVSYNSDINIPATSMFRLKARAKSQSINLISSSLDNGVIAPSVVVSIVRI
jgi:hypothetical protein